MSALNQYFLTVNKDSQKLVDPADGIAIKAQDKPVFYFGTENILCLEFIDRHLNVSPFGETDTFSLAIDTDMLHTSQGGTLKTGVSGAITSITILGLTTAPSKTGAILLENDDYEKESVGYTDWSENSGEYTFTVDTTLSNSYANGDTSNISDTLMTYSDGCDITDDWADISRENGKISFRVDCNKIPFREKVRESSSDQLEVFLEIKRYVVGSTTPSIILQDKIYANKIVHDTETDPTDIEVNFYNIIQSDARFIQIANIVDDRVSTDTDKPLSANQGKLNKDEITALQSDKADDINVLHKAIANELGLITSKSTLVADDIILIEDSQDSNSKKSAILEDLPISTLTQTAINTKINITDIIDNVTSTDTDKPLSANQGKLLNDNIQILNNNMTTKAFAKKMAIALGG